MTHKRAPRITRGLVQLVGTNDAELTASVPTYVRETCTAFTLVSFESWRMPAVSGISCVKATYIVLEMG